MMEKGDAELFKVGDGSVRQPPEPPLSRSRESGKKDAAFHSIGVLMERGCVVKLTQMVIRVRCSIVLAYRRRHVVLG